MDTHCVGWFIQPRNISKGCTLAGNAPRVCALADGQKRHRLLRSLRIDQHTGPHTMIEPLLLSTTQVSTYKGRRLLTRASGFFFLRDSRLYLVTSRHVLLDPPTAHFPDRIELELHTDGDNMTQTTGLSILLYRDGLRIWAQSEQSGHDVGIDVAVIELDQWRLPASVVLQAFTPRHLLSQLEDVEVGQSLLIIGFPLGFHDTLHHLPVARQAIVASSFGLRFQGQGLFITDARTHRGSSGAPVVVRNPMVGNTRHELPWTLLGIHSSRLDMSLRDRMEDEFLGLNTAWYADVLMTLTDHEPTWVEPTVPSDARTPVSLLALQGSRVSLPSLQRAGGE